MKKQTIMAVILIAVLTASACAQQGGKSINSADDLKKYLDSQPANSPEKPIKVSMSVNDLLIKNVEEVIKNAGKFVSLDLSKSTGLITIEEGTFWNVKALVEIIIPSSVTYIDDDAFTDCTNLTSVTFLGANIYLDDCFDDELLEKFYETGSWGEHGTPGTYTRPKDSWTWTKK